MKSEVTKEHGAILCWVAVLILTFGFTGTTNAKPIGLGSADRFLFLTPTRIDEGGGSNSYIGDIGAPEITGWNPDSFVGIWVYDQATLNAAVADAFRFSELLLKLPADDVISSPYPGQWSTVKPGLNVVTVLGGTLETTILPYTIVGSATQTVVLNVLATGEVRGGIQTTGGLLPEKLIVNCIGPSKVRLGLGSSRTAGTYLIRSGTVIYGAGSGGLDGAVIAPSNVDINIDGGSNLFIRRPFNPSAIPELSTLIGLEIVGPGEVAENFSASYKAIAYYDDGSTKDVTDSAFWSVEPTMVASIEAGVLTTKDIVEGQLATIRAGYTEGGITVEGQKEIYIFALVGIEITGPEEVAENSSTVYKAIACYENNKTWDVTDSALWVVEPALVASIEAGVLTTKDIAEGLSATVQASYTQGDVTIESQKVIHIFALVGIEITGPQEVAENSSATYKAIAYYENGNTKDVTDWALWAVEPNMYASIDDYGVMTTKNIVKDQPATIWADYTEGNTTFEAEKAIDIFTICPTGTALQFDGIDDYIDCGSDKSLDVTELTWSLWIKRAETTCTNERALISNEGGGENKNGTYALQIDVGGQYQDRIQFVRHGDDVKNCPLSETAIQDTNWHHVAVTRNINNEVIIYIDGVLDSSGTIDTRTEFTKTVIGAGHTSYSNFNGKIDEVMIFNRDLSTEEIQANMNTRLQGDEPGLVGYWDFDDGDGQIVYDLSGNENHGQLGSTPDVDASDPAWIKSDAPVGRCTPYLIATGAARNALKHKRASLQELEAAISQELTMYEAIEQWLKSGDYGDLDKGDIVTARQRTHSAIQHQEQSENALEIGIENLKDALSKLGHEFIPPNANITYPPDGSELSCCQTIVVEAHAWDVDGSVVSVEFFADGTKIGEDDDGTDGWTINWSDHPVSTYTLTARVMDDDEAMTTSPAVTITLLETPGRAANPNPTDGATSVAVNTDLSWNAGINAVSHDVYFGTSSPGTFRGNQTATTFDPGKMTYNKTYYWRIDGGNPSGTTTGTVWTFKTAGGPLPPLPPPT